jgi:hypothetical protein
LTIIANHDIIFESGSGIDFAGSGDVILKVVNNVVIDGDISLNGGDFSSTHIESDELNPGTPGVDFDNNFQSSGMLTTLGGSVNIDHLGDVTIGAAIDTTGGSGAVEIDGSSITVNDNITAGGDITLYNAVTAAAANPIQTLDAAGNLTAMGDITKTTVGELVLNSGSGTLYLGHNVRGTHVDGSDITFNSDVIANGTGDNSDQAFTATGILTANGDIEKSTAGELALGTSGGTLYMGHNVRGTHVDGSDITFNSDVIANGIGDNSDQEFTATGTLTANGDIEKSTAGGLTLGTSSGALYLGHNVRGTDIAGSDITFACDVIANGIADHSDQEFSASGTLTANGYIRKTTTGNLALGGWTLIDLDGVDGVTGDSVTVTSGGLTIEDVVDAEGGLTASGPVWLKGDSSTNYVVGDIIGNGVEFSASAVDVELDGAGDQTIDAGTGQLIAAGTITKTNSGSLTLSSAYGGPEPAIDLEDEVVVQTTGGDLTITDDLDAAALLQADGSVDLQDDAILHYRRSGCGGLAAGRWLC